MRSTIISFVFAALLVTVSAGLAMSQTTPAGTFVGPTVPVEIAEQPECPLRITVTGFSLVSPPVLRASVENVGGRLIKAFVIVDSGGKGHSNTSIYHDGSLEPGKSRPHGIIIRKDQNKVVLSVDYVEYVDGGTWGLDLLGRSKVIAAYLSGWNLAIERLKVMMSELDRDPSDLLHVLEMPSGYTLGGAASPALPNLIEKQRFVGYRQVMYILRATKVQKDAAREFARKLELMEPS